jgi:hypothetical protein
MNSASAIYDATPAGQLIAAGVPCARLVVGYHVRAGENTKVEQATAAAIAAKCRLVLDWEIDAAFERCDPLRSDRQTVAASVAQAGELLDRAIRRHGSIDVSMYGLAPPVPTHYNRIRNDATWPEYRKALGPLVDGPNSLVDRLPRLHPTLYLPDAWPQDWPRWRAHAETVVSRVANVCKDWQKPCLPFVRPKYFRTPEDWAEYVAIVREHCAGVVVWEVDIMPAEYWEVLR